MITLDTRILIVDDSISFLALLKKNLVGLGYNNILQAENGFKGMALLQNFAANPEKKIGLILSDWNMPECNGLEFFKLVKANPTLKDTPFIMVTSENEVSQIIEAVSLGVTDYIVKPPEAEVLKRKIDGINASEAKGKRNVGKS